MTIRWEAHACLSLHPQADFSPLEQLRAAGVHHVSLNIGMDMNPQAQILPVLAAYRARIAAHPERFRLVCSVAEIKTAVAVRRRASLTRPCPPGNICPRRCASTA